MWKPCACSYYGDQVAPFGIMEEQLKVPLEISVPFPTFISPKSSGTVRNDDTLVRFRNQNVVNRQLFFRIQFILFRAMTF